jgi:hypothetical protein
MVPLLFVMLQAADVVVAEHSRGTDYVQTNIEAACGDRILRIQYRNENARRGQVTFVNVNNRDVFGAAFGLQNRAANRAIVGIEIMNCGWNERDPEIRGVMALSELESRRDNLPPRVYFRVRQVDGSWRISWD